MPSEACSWYPDLDPRGPFRWPLLDGRLAYFNREGEIEWVAPRQHEERNPFSGVEWWWSATLGETIHEYYCRGDGPEVIATRLNVPIGAVAHFLADITPTAEARPDKAQAPRLSPAAGFASEKATDGPHFEPAEESSSAPSPDRLALLHQDLSELMLWEWQWTRLESRFDLVLAIQDESDQART
jgi:hypothetical protein